MTNSKLSVVQNIKAVNFPFMGWCGFTTTVFTVDLSDVSDVDLVSSVYLDPPGSGTITVLQALTLTPAPASPSIFHHKS